MSNGIKVVARGVVIRKASSGDGSTRVLLYTDGVGLVWAHAQSAREERSQLRSHIQVGTRGVYSLVKGRDVWRLSGILRTENMHFSLSEKSETQKTLQRVLLFVRQFVRGEGSDPYFFTVLWGFFDSLHRYEGEALKDAEHAVILRMLAALGYVEGGDDVHRFLEASYDVPILADVGRERKTVLAAINQGIAVSGLS